MLSRTMQLQTWAAALLLSLVPLTGGARCPGEDLLLAGLDHGFPAEWVPVPARRAKRIHETLKG